MNGDMTNKLDRGKFWQEHITAWEQSGLKQRLYCEQQRISFYAFGYWRTQFNQQLKLAAQKHFVEIPVGVHKGSSQPVMQIMLPNGVRIGISHDASVQMIREALGVVSSC